MRDKEGQSDKKKLFFSASKDRPGMFNYTPLAKLGTKINYYKIIDVLGEGGYGVVYLAEQSQPVKRQVALKVVKPGMDSNEVLSRFEGERQTLALLDHPNITRIFDAGTTREGHPYFVMEYIDGLPITQYCDQHKLNIEQRLRLFIQVCEAIQHAHQKGIIHRDIKPTNILVSVYENQPLARIIDFGVAKAVSQTLTKQTLHTRDGQMIGTPEYMSPEQVDLVIQDIDTRSDVYSLGAVLYELLTGVQPYDPETLHESGFESIRRTIVEQVPLRPSTRLLGLSEKAREIAERRGTYIGPLIKCLGKELEWIPLKAMRKERTHRYRSASELADDIRNYLNNAPLIAGPESTIYQVQKFMRKHRVSVTAATAVVISLIIGLVISFMMYHRVQQALDTVNELENRMDSDRSLVTAERLNAEGRYDAALEEIEMAFEGKTQEPKVLLLKAELLFELGQIEDAEDILQQLIDEEPEIAGAAHYLLARINLGVDSVKANGHKRKAEMLLPETAEAYSIRAMTAVTPEEALQWLSKAITLNPSHYSSRKARALAYYGRRNYQRMLEDVGALIALRPKDSLGYALRAMTRRESGQLEAAIEDHNRAITLCTLKNELPELYYQRRETYLRMNNLKAALEDARHCVVLEPKEVFYRFNLFDILVMLSDYEAARNEYWKTIQQSSEWDRLFKYWINQLVFNILNARQHFELPVDVAQKAPFYEMQETAKFYHMLEKRATRLLYAAEANGSWSPDGKQFAYEYAGGYAWHEKPLMTATPAVSGTCGIHTLDTETGNEKLLVSFGYKPTWSPNGKYIAFVHGSRRYSSYPNEIWVVQTAGGDPKQLAFGRWPVWGSDSNRLFFRSLDNMLCYVKVDNPASQPKTILPCAGDFAVSPDEKYVAIGYNRSKKIRLVEISTNLVVAEWISPLPHYSWRITWSPNGKELSLVGTGWYGGEGLWIYDIQRKEAWHVLGTPAHSISWSPDGSKLAIHILGEIWFAELDPNIPTYHQLDTAISRDDFINQRLERQSNRIAMDPLDAENYLIRALYKFSLQDYEKASTDLDEFGRLVKTGDDPMWWAICWWAWLYYRDALHKEAELLCLKALNISSQVQNTNLPHLLNPLENLIRNYEAWGKHELADQWRARLFEKEPHISN